MPTARHSLVTSVVNGSIYAIGGGEPGVPLAVVEAYDPITDTWTRKANMLHPGLAFACSTLDGRIYVFGIGDAVMASSRVAEYDPLTDTWQEGMSMPTARIGASASTISSEIYVVGGVGVGSVFSSAMEAYSPAMTVSVSSPRAVVTVVLGQIKQSYR